MASFLVLNFIAIALFRHIPCYHLMRRKKKERRKQRQNEKISCLPAQMQTADLLFSKFRSSCSFKEDFIVLQKRDVKNKATRQSNDNLHNACCLHRYHTFIQFYSIRSDSSRCCSNGVATQPTAIILALPLNLYSGVAINMREDNKERVHHSGHFSTELWLLDYPQCSMA